MSKYQRTKFNKDNDDLLANSKNYLDQDNIQDNILFSKTSSSNNKRKQNSLKNKLNSNLVDKLAMDSGLGKKSNLIGLNSITNPIHSELNESLTEIELDNDDNSTTIHHLDLLSNNNNQRMLSAHNQTDHLINNYNDKSNSNQNQHELSNMKRMLVSLDTNLDNNSNLNRSYIYSTNTLADNAQQQAQQQQSPNHHNNDNQQRSIGLMNAVHLNNCSNGFQASTPNVSFFGLQTSAIDHSGNTIFGNFGKFKSNARFSTFFRHLKFIWRRATMLERLLTLFLLLLLFTICYLSFTVLTLKQLNKNLEAEKPKYCLTPQCINVASAMLSAMNTNVSPCDDFYTYSCGSWIQANPLPSGKSIWGAFGKLWQENQLAMKNVLEENVTYTSDAENKAKIYYRSCLDKNETIEKLSSKPMLDFIDQINGWNITGNVFNVKNWSLADSLEVLHCKYNRGGLFSWAVGADERNSSRHVLQLDQAPLGLPSPAYYALNGSDDSILRTYEKYMIKIAQLLRRSEKFLNKTSGLSNLDEASFFSYRTDERDDDSELMKVSSFRSPLNFLENFGANGYTANIKDYEKHLIDEYEEDKEIERQMKLVLEFEVELANITVPLEERRDDERIYHKLTLKELQELSPAIDWLHYFRYAFEPINYTITDTEPIIVYSPDYIKEMSNLINKYMATDDKKVVLANYLAWTAVQSLSSYLSKPFRDASKILRKALIGSEGKESAWRYCVTDTNSVMGFALGAMFVDSVFKGEAKVIAQEMIEQIREAFKENLQSLDWMDTNTKKLATEKADAITDMIGFPDFILDADKLDEKYEGLNFSETEYFDNNIKVNIFSLQKNIEKIFKPANKSEWQMSPPTVNAYYTPTKNQIVFPAGILQTPFYDIHYPKSLNYGAIGVVVGHELSKFYSYPFKKTSSKLIASYLAHAFDDQGREYDKFGNLHQWWKNSTINNFKDRMQCFIDQYGAYQSNGDKINGKQTLGENIADNGGLKASYRAYEKWLSNHEPELALPGINLTNHQLFFIGFAQVWCSVSTIESQRLQILNDPHSPAEFRVRGTLSNSEEFAKSFNCPVGTTMNPKDKCTIW